MPLRVVRRVELRRPAAAGAAFLAVAGVVGLVRDGAADTASAQVGAVLAGGMRFVGADPIGANTRRPARPQPGDPDAAQDDLELRAVAALSGRDDDRHGPLALLDGQVQFGGQAAARASEPVIVRLGGDAAERLLL